MIPSPGDQEILDIPFGLFIRICDELQSMGTRSLILIGEGEPFLHPRLLDLIVTAKDAGLHVTLLTNGTLLDEKRIQPLIDSRLDILKVSLWGCSEEEYARNYPGVDLKNFKKIIGRLKCLSTTKVAQKSKLPLVILHTPITRHNFQSLDKRVELAHETGCNILTFSPLKIRRGELAGEALATDEERQVVLTLSRIERELNSLSIKHNIKEMLLRYRIGEAVWQKLPCYIAWLHVRIKVDGTVLPCNPCELPIGNLNENSLPGIWNSLAMKNFRRQVLLRQGLAEMTIHCDCGYCCHTLDNWRTDRVFRWLSPFLGARRLSRTS
jgi:MoaA/NifB/PqqE/SkfB family radical SAM enzyme